jgi:ABC-type sugar transport system substrate-binding protein
MVRRAQAEGELAATVDPDALAWGVRAFIQGMSQQLLYDQVPEESVRSQCQWVVDAIFRG